MQCSAVQCSVVQCSTVQCSAVPCSATRSSAQLKYHCSLPTGLTLACLLLSSVTSPVIPPPGAVQCVQCVQCIQCVQCVQCLQCIWCVQCVQCIQCVQCVQCVQCTVILFCVSDFWPLQLCPEVQCIFLDLASTLFLLPLEEAGHHSCSMSGRFCSSWPLQFCSGWPGCGPARKLVLGLGQSTPLYLRLGTVSCHW